MSEPDDEAQAMLTQEQQRDYAAALALWEQKLNVEMERVAQEIFEDVMANGYFPAPRARNRRTGY